MKLWGFRKLYERSVSSRPERAHSKLQKRVFVEKVHVLIDRIAGVSPNASAETLTVTELNEYPAWPIDGKKRVTHENKKNNNMVLKKSRTEGTGM